MYDRIPTPGREGRVLITPEDGSPSFYATIAMADNPLQEGTPLSKATVLADYTASAYGLDKDAVPNDLFFRLAGLVQYGYRQRYVKDWKVPVVIPAPTATNKYLSYHEKNSGNQVTVTYAQEADVDENGQIYLLDPQTVTISYDDYSPAQEALKNCFFLDKDSEVFFAGEGVRIGGTSSDSGYTVYIRYYNRVTVGDNYFSDWADYVATKEQKLPAEGIDGQYRTALYGQAKQNALYPLRVVTGSYVGTGTYGEDNPNVIDFVTIDPIFVILSGPWWKNSAAISNRSILLTPHTAVLSTDTNPLTVTVAPNGSTWSIWSTASTSSDNKEYAGAQQANMAGRVYHWIAIGR